MAVGVWMMTEECEFELMEPYKTWVLEARLAATKGWRDGMIGYLEGKTPYSRDVLRKELLRRNNEMGDDEEPGDMVEAFIIAAISGEL